MDIYKWLNSTELHQNPDSLEDHTCSNVKLSPSKPKQCKVYGKLDVAAPELGLNFSLGVCEQRRRLRSCSTPSGSARKQALSLSRTSSTSKALSECFERRPRRKTRADLYEPYSDARKRRSHRKESKGEKATSKGEALDPKYHRTKRVKSGKERPGQVLMKNFRAKNVPQERLTVGLLLAFPSLEGACANVSAS